MISVTSFTNALYTSIEYSKHFYLAKTSNSIEVNKPSSKSATTLDQVRSVLISLPVPVEAHVIFGSTMTRAPQP
jgi:hypothetical protein